MKIVLVRHGRSAHVHTGWIDGEGFARWREAYEAAGIDERDTPPRELQTLASAAGLVVASDALRAIESARLLAPRKDVVTSPLLREIALVPPKIPFRMPLLGWALTLFRMRATEQEHQRARDAASWLVALAAQHEQVVVVTHGGFRIALASALAARGWRCETPKRRHRHWSAWPFTS
jgi:broad specificity phosphatase PhoE